MKNLKIGITLQNGTAGGLWSNGLNLNILHLVKTLQSSPNNYEISLLSTKDFDRENLPSHLKNVSVCKIEEKYKEIDLLITMGAQPTKEIIKDFKSVKDKKLVTYRCGNDYIFVMEQVLFKSDGGSFGFYEDCMDEVWYVPQQHENNHGYYKTLFRTNAIPVPFVWDPHFIDLSTKQIDREFLKKQYKKDSKYNPNKIKKTVAILEPNINFIKFCLLPSMIVELCYRGQIGKNHINKLMITNCLHLTKDKTFLSIINTFDIFKDKKLTADARYQTSYLLSQFADVLISHQSFNPLNYLYFDAAHMGYPLLHNAHLCKDLGYYYEGNDLQQGAQKLEWILMNHDKNIEEYNLKNQKVLSRYLASSPAVVATYDKLIDNLYKEKNIGLIYNPQTNIYDNLDIT